MTIRAKRKQIEQKTQAENRDQKVPDLNAEIQDIVTEHKALKRKIGADEINSAQGDCYQRHPA